jgi:hypothetical protein
MVKANLKEILENAILHLKNADNFARKGQELLMEYYIHMCERQLSKYAGPTLESIEAMRGSYSSIRRTLREYSEERARENSPNSKIVEQGV